MCLKTENRILQEKIDIEINKNAFVGLSLKTKFFGLNFFLIKV